MTHRPAPRWRRQGAGRGSPRGRFGARERLLDVASGVLALEERHAPALPVVYQRRGHDTAPVLVDPVDERLIGSRRPHVDGEGRPALAHERLDRLAIHGLVDGNGDERHVLALPRQRRQLRELLHARLAPRGPQRDHDRLPAVGGHGPPHPRPVELAREDRGRGRENERRVHWATRLIVQPNAFVSATGTALPARTASSAWRRSWLLMFAPLRSSSIRPW